MERRIDYIHATPITYAEYIVREVQPETRIIGLFRATAAVSDDEAKHNAQLFNAAPALLAALEDLLGDAPDLFHNNECRACGRRYYTAPKDRLCESDDCPRVKARAAIRQAKGEG